MDRIAVYCRLSKEDVAERNESESIQNQKNLLTAYAEKMNYEIYNIYVDDGISAAYSGAENERPAFLQMIADAERGKFNIVLCKSQSRFSRNAEVVEKYIHGLFVEKGIRFIGLVDNADSAVKGNKKARQINSLINEWYLEDLSENVKSVLKNKMQRGEYIGSFAPYGYKKDARNRNRLIINEETADVVRMIFDWSIHGFGAVKICRMLNDMNIPNPRKQQEKDGLRTVKMYSENDSGKWSASTINDILHNIEYTGCIAQHKTEKVSYKHKKIHKVGTGEWIIAENTHEAIISKSDFEQVQINMGKKRKADGTGKVHLLSGLVYCGQCGSCMQKNYNRRYLYLRCREKYTVTESECRTPNIRLDFILDSMNYEFIRNTIIEFVKENKSVFGGDNIRKITLEKRITELKSEYRKYDTAKRNLYVDKCGGIITESEYLRYKSEFEDKNEVIENNIKSVEKELRDISDNAQSVQNILDSTNIEKAVINSLIEKIIFGKCIADNKTELRFIWNI